MIHLQNISLAFAGQPLFENLDWFIRANKRIGLIGPNGAGKTTLLKILAGKIPVDAGEISMSGSLQIGYLEQGVQEYDPERSVLEEARMAFAPLLDLEKEIHDLTHDLDADEDHESEEYRKKLFKLERLQTRWSTFDAHRVEDRTAAVLTGLGFEPDELHHPLRTFSGGWRMRAVLARILLTQPDFLLLDEPTNHLDIESIDWLEGYLKSYPGTVMLVSHDRYFLDRMVDTIAELANGQVTEYAGNYAFYLEERVARRLLQQSAFDNQQQWIKETERFIERFRYKASKARQVQSRIKSLERLERLNPPPSEQASIRFRFPEPPRSGRITLHLSRFGKTYPVEDGPDNVVFADSGPLHIERGDKIALVGKNGAGKSTLARMLRGTEPFTGTRELGYNVELTYFAQHQAEALDISKSVLEVVSEHAPGQSETQVRSLLGAFLFHGDDVYKPVGVLSGGERSRVALAATLLEPANFMILDEPTNHLDMASIGVLIEALNQFSGTFVVVSHDRHFLDQVANRIWYVAGGDVTDYPGNYSDFLWKTQKASEPEPTSLPGSDLTPLSTSDPSAPSGPKTKAQKRLEAEARQKIAQLLKNADDSFDTIDWSTVSNEVIRQLFSRVEGQIAKTEAEKKSCETRLADPLFYAEGSEYSRTLAAYEAAEAKLLTLYERWETLGEHL